MRLGLGLLPVEIVAGEPIRTIADGLSAPAKDGLAALVLSFPPIRFPPNARLGQKYRDVLESD
jgi:hypothetical protein